MWQLPFDRKVPHAFFLYLDVHMHVVLIMIICVFLSLVEKKYSMGETCECLSHKRPNTYYCGYFSQSDSRQQNLLLEGKVERTHSFFSSA
jgi:hypothetical protein